jgi:hypothetical protein
MLRLTANGVLVPSRRRRVASAAEKLPCKSCSLSLQSPSGSRSLVWYFCLQCRTWAREGYTRKICVYTPFDFFTPSFNDAFGGFGGRRSHQVNRRGELGSASSLITCSLVGGFQLTIAGIQQHANRRWRISRRSGWRASIAAALMISRSPQKTAQREIVTALETAFTMTRIGYSANVIVPGGRDYTVEPSDMSSQLQQRRASGDRGRNRLRRLNHTGPVRLERR